MNKSTRNSCWILIALLLMLGVAVPVDALESSASAITVSPLIIELSGNPGSTVQGQTVEVSNLSDTAAVRYLYPMDFVPTSDQGQAHLVIPGSTVTPYSLGPWIQVDPVQVTLQPQEKKKVSFSISVPTSAEPGDHYGAVVVGTKPLSIEKPDSENQNEVGYSSRVATLVLLKVAGTVHEQLDVIGFRAKHQLFDQLPAEISLRIVNSGNVHEVPIGSVTIYRVGSESKVATMLMNEEGGRVLPASNRNYVVSWTQTDPVNWGQYRAVVAMTYGEQHQSLTATTTFWVFPWKLIVIGLVAFLILFIIFRLYVHRAVKQAVAQHR